jgi:murein DD-endopeptidase MepM/ murein hydrolase activator NlpD
MNIFKIQIFMINIKGLVFSAFCLLLSGLSLSAQPIQIDIDEGTQNRLISGLAQNCDLSVGFNQNTNTIITNINNLPAYSLYNNQWDTLNLCSKKMVIPFFDSQIKIMLVQEGNMPFAFPISCVVSTGYVKIKNKQHTGVDFAVQKKEPVVACFDGVVRIAKKYEEYGNTVVIRHYNGLETVYALLDNVNVVTNQKVNAGDLVGYVGESSDKKSALHFEIRFFNYFFNPELMINFSERKLKDNMLTLTPKDFSMENTRGKAIFHTVARGETIYKVCAKYNITEQQLRKLNQIKGDNLIVGQKLRIQ